ncbi:MAG: tRNA (adenosine(37)-N6)-threonylcarbamoyltransferase complex ATPase subunit type 1 TsaE [Crocinitomicaceae bacterium]|nr:tRNA (adenosine(37)-N6)-threonylcarbamoyltransferase complex ATPase subunit type 1 TsaE [Crocinitomicaceae bacterium]
MKITVASLSELPAAAEAVLKFLKDHDRKFVIFRGDMGYGKTTLINELLKQMGVEEAGSSPTFSILNEYFSVNYGIIFHFDFYRIEDEIEAYDIGIEEIFEEDAYIFIEWPERIENLLSSDIVCLTIRLEEKTRIFELEVL